MSHAQQTAYQDQTDARAISPGTFRLAKPRIRTQVGWYESIGFHRGRGVKTPQPQRTKRHQPISELAEMPELVKSSAAVLDGEIVCLDDDGKPSFTRLQHILQSKRATRNRSHPAHFIAFDLLYSGGRSVMKEPLLKRKSRLINILNPTELIQACEFVETEGTAFFQATCELGLEGIMARRKAARHT